MGVIWFLLACLWLFAKVAIGAGILLLVAGINWRIRDAFARRRKRRESERRTWAESVTKQTKPPTIREAVYSQDVDLTGLVSEIRPDPDPDLAAYIALKTPVRQKQAAEAVRKKIKRSKK